MVSYEKLIIFYFSGTGNAKKVAEWLNEYAINQGIKSSIHNIAKLDEFPIITGNELIGFIAPTHGFNFPPIMLKFLLKFPKSMKNKAFIVNTRAGMKLYKLFLPGLSGLAQFFAALVLRLKGYTVVGMQPMDLPSNWISLHPGLRQKVVISIFDRCKRKSLQFAEKVFNGGRKYKAFLSLPFDLAIMPIAILYYFIGRFAIAKTFAATNSCNLCKRCIENCPVKAIKEVNNKPFWTFNCESCMHCMNICPHRAIETAHAYTFFIWWIIFSLVPGWLYFMLIENALNVFSLNPGFSNFIINVFHVASMFLILFISYHLLHFLMKFPLFEKIIRYSSLTHYNWWRRYKAPKVF